MAALLAPCRLHFPWPFYSLILWETQLPLLHYAEQFNSQTSLGSGPTLQIQKLINVSQH